jgi:hypothetical protein
MYFGTKNYLKSTRNHTTKQARRTKQPFKTTWPTTHQQIHSCLATGLHSSMGCLVCTLMAVHGHYVPPKDVSTPILQGYLASPCKVPKTTWQHTSPALSSDYIPSLWLMHSQAFVTDALSMSSCHLFQSPLPLEWSIGAQDCKYAFAAELIDMHGKQEIIVQQEFFISLQHKVLFLSSINLQTSLDSRNIIKKKRCISWVMRNT